MSAQTNSIPAVGKPNDIVDIKAGMLFPFPFRVFGVILMLTGVAMLIVEPLASVLFVLIGIGVVTAYEGTEIDLVKTTFREYYSFLMIRKGTRRRYPQIDKLIMHASQLQGNVPLSNFWRWQKFDEIEFNAYVRFSDGTRIFLFGGKDRDAVMDRLQKIGSTIKVAVVDHTRRATRPHSP